MPSISNPHLQVLLAGLVAELGYPCASSKEAFKHTLRLAPQACVNRSLCLRFTSGNLSLGPSNRAQLDEAALAQMLGVVARTHSGLDTSPSNFTRSSFSAASFFGPLPFDH